ncbi:MAG: hypothetical protein V3575_04785 [Candidatus Absconditabacteria bacterium]
MFKLSSFKENLLAFAMACFLSLGVLLLINNTSMFQADVLNGNTNGIGEASQGNLSYSIVDGKYTIKSEQEFQGVISLSMVVAYDASKIESFEDLIDSNYDHTFGDQGEGRVTVYITNLPVLSKGDELFSLETKLNEPTVNFSSIKAKFADGEVETLSITRK